MQVLLRGPIRAIQIACFAIFVLAFAACVKYRKFEYADAQVSFGTWEIVAGLAPDAWSNAEDTKERTRDLASPYVLWVRLHGVPPTATVSVEDVAITSVTDGTTIPVVLDPVTWWNEAAYSGSPRLDLAYIDYVITARVTVKSDSEVIQRSVTLALNRAYSEEHSDLITELIMSI